MFGLILPNMIAKSVGLFLTGAGTANAVFGTLLGAIVFLITSFATIFKTNTQLPMVIMYEGILFICLFLFIIKERTKIKKLKKDKNLFT